MGSPFLGETMTVENKDLLQEGDIIELFNGDVVYGLLPNTMIYANTPGDWTLSRHEVMIGEYGYRAGKYIVTKTSYEGGGTAMGPHDIYPDGHHVFCQHAEYPNVKVDFYQTGSFTAMLPGKKAIGKAKRVWTT